MAEALNSQVVRQAPRSPFEIMMDILRVAAAGSVKPTHIMYRSNTSWMTLQRNLESLVASGFIRQTDERSRVEYTITESGREVLREYVSLLDDMNSAQAEVRS